MSDRSMEELEHGSETRRWLRLTLKELRETLRRKSANLIKALTPATGRRRAPFASRRRDNTQPDWRVRERANERARLGGMPRASAPQGGAPRSNDLSERVARESLQNRHAAHFLKVCGAWAEGVDAHGGLTLRRRLERESENLIAAVRRALSADPQSLASISTALRGTTAKPRFVALISASGRSNLRSRPTSTRSRARCDSSATFARNARVMSDSLGTSPGHASPSARASSNNTGRLASLITASAWRTA